MRKAYNTLDLTEAVLLKDHLLHNGVAASLRNKGAVRTPAEGIASEVWVADDADDSEVRGLIRAFLERRSDAATRVKASWRCRRCREDVPGGFESCWNCGEERAGASGGS